MANRQRSNRIQLDYNFMLAENIGRGGITRAAIQRLAPAVRQAHRELLRRREAGTLGFADLPRDEKTIGEILGVARIAAARFENLLVLGIGGSALGNIALHRALNHPLHNLLPPARRGHKPRVFVYDNVDPAQLAGLLDVLDLRRTLVNVITKSGSTAETMSAFMLLRQRLRAVVGAKNLNRHIVATTDREHGTLRRIVEREGYISFPVPANVGGRFSVLSAVGLFSAAVSGIPIRELIAGAREADRFTSGENVWTNPAYLAAAFQIAGYRQGRPLSVLMPYAHALGEFADWYRQLWAESLGKRVDKQGRTVRVGPTPVKALGATDQHSQLQLYMEGPADKTVTFLRVETFAADPRIPALYREFDSLAYLGGHRFGELLNTEQTATALALASVGQPSATWRVPAVTPRYVGQLIFTFEVMTAMAGELLNIDTFNQPGVEAGKVAISAMLGRPGFRKKYRDMLRRVKTQRKHVL